MKEGEFVISKEQMWEKLDVFKVLTSPPGTYETCMGWMLKLETDKWKVN